MLMILAILALVIASPAMADVTYTITVTDEQAESVAEQARIMNESGGPVRAKGASYVPVTPEQFIQRATRSLIDQWEHGQHEQAVRKSNAERTPREKRLICRKLDLTPCPK